MSKNLVIKKLIQPNSLENISDSAYFYLPKYGNKLIYLEELKIINHRLAKLDAHAPGFIPPKRSARGEKNVKKGSFSVGIRTGWYPFFMKERNKNKRFSSSPEAISPQADMPKFSCLIAMKNLQSLSVQCSG